MINRERIEKHLEELLVEIYTFFCSKCKRRLNSYQELEECPFCESAQEEGKLSLVELRIEMREVIFANCPNCRRLVSKTVIQCPSCGEDTLPVLNLEGQGLSRIFLN